MKFIETPLKGAFVIEHEPVFDERGFFARTFCAREFRERGLCCDIAQCSVSHNIKKGTLRGLHYQRSPHEEIKLVRCIRGEIFDVIVDIQKSSETYLKWFGTTLSSENGKALYIPKGFAHGFLTIEDDSQIFYQISEFFYADSSAGIAWNDPEIGIEWTPLDCEFIISEKDRRFPQFLG